MRQPKKSRRRKKPVQQPEPQAATVSPAVQTLPVTELLDLGQLAPILEDFCSAVGVSSAITDLKGSILVCARWERICGEFHRANQQTCARCFASDAELAAKLREDKPYVIWQCKNGLVEAAAPITIQGTHVATAFVGQFLLDQPDRESFRTRAREFGFDEADYLRALDEVPVVSSEKLGAILGFLSGFTRLVVHLSLERLKVLDAKSSCELSVADSEQAREELLRRRAQLETLVEERTEKLRQSEEHSRLILQAVAEGIIETDISGLCTFFNDAALKMLGYGVEELIGRSLHELFHHSNADGSPHLREQCPIYLAYSQGITSFRRDEVFWRKDGSFFDISYTSVPQRKGDDIIGAIVVFRDITNRKKTEDALLESETRLKSILATANEGFWWIDNDLRTVEVNDMMCNLLGRRREEILGRTPYEFLDEENMAIMKEEIKRRIKGETSVYEIAVIRPDGSKVYSLFHATPLFDKNKVKTGAFALVTDITPHKKMAEELIIARNKAEAATRAKSDFLANMSHEIRTPMNAVLGMTHLALKTELTPKQKDYLTKIQISANSLLGVINDILDFSKIEAGKLSMESIGFNLDEVLDNLATQITIKAQEKEGLEVLFSTDADVPRSLVGDPLRLSQILLNLANNAIKFTEHGEIVVSAELVSLEKKRAAIQFSVRDTGIGLSPEHMARLFSSFSQADNSITRKYGGSGLGLAICQRLVEMMGGKIWVESTPGVGSTFFFTAVFGTDRHAEKLRHVLPPELRGIRALVVDDNPTSQEIFQTMLESFSFQVTLTATGEEAVQEIERSIEDEAYDIVIMDWKLPGMDGIEAAKRIKRNPRLTEIPPIVLVSAYGREEIMWRAEMAGLEAFLLKPISPSVMFDTIMSVLAKDAFKDSDLIDQKKADSRDIKSLQGARVLLVEDNEINQQVAMEMLVAEGVVVSLAKNGREALEAVNADRYDVVLMDIQMPVMDGYTATRIIRADPRFKDLPIIAMTAHAMAGDQEKSLDAGMNDHINKPVDPVQLYTVLEKWISGVACPIHPESTSPAIPSEPVAEPVAIADPAAAPEPPFPTSLEGFNLADGMRRLRGNKTLYRKLLLNFGSQYTHKTDEIRQALNEADYPAAHQLVHDVKGLAGSLAASHLQAAAAELEKLVKTADKQNPPPAQALADALTDLQVTMDQALCSAQSLAPEPMAQSPAPLPGSTPILPPELAAEAAQRLREAAEMGDVSGLGAIVEEMVTRSADFTPYRDKITQLADDFDFDGIVALAGELADSENV